MSDNYNPHAPGDRPEWYTPQHIITFAEKIFGDKPDLDPASCQEANEIVQARRYFTAEDDGLRQPWATNMTNPTVWCNPPYGRKHQTRHWWRKMKTEFDSGAFHVGLFLANAKTDTIWFHEALDTCPILLVRGRLNFWRTPSIDDDTNTGHFGTALVLLSRPLYHPPVSYKHPLSPYNAEPSEDVAFWRFTHFGDELGKVIVAI